MYFFFIHSLESVSFKSWCWAKVKQLKVFDAANTKNQQIDYQRALWDKTFSVTIILLGGIVI